MLEKIKRLIIISRPMFWVQFGLAYWWGMIVAGNHWDLMSVLGLVFYTFPMGIIVFGINDIADIESDAQNERKGGLDGAVLKRSEASLTMRAAIASTVIPIIIFGLGQRYLLAITILGNLMFSYAYSLKPIRLKSVPVADSTSNGVWALLMFLSGYWALGESLKLTFPPVHQMLALVLLVAVYHALGTVLDYDVDKKAGDKTISVFLGKRQVAALSTALLVICFFLVRSRAIEAFFALSALFSLLILLKPEPQFIKRIERLYFLAIAIPLPFVYLLLRS